MLNRRQLLSRSAQALAGATLAGAALAAPQPTPGGPTTAPARRGNRIGVSTYSFWRFRPDSKLSIEQCIEQSAAMGFDAVEVLHRQMDKEDNAALQAIKRAALREGIGLCGFSIHQGFLSPDKAERQKNVDHTIHCIELAYA